MARPVLDLKINCPVIFRWINKSRDPDNLIRIILARRSIAVILVPMIFFRKLVGDRGETVLAHKIETPIIFLPRLAGSPVEALAESGALVEAGPIMALFKSRLIVSTSGSSGTVSNRSIK